MLGELEVDSRIVVCDLEAGVGTLLRMQEGQADVVLVVTQSSAKSIDVARRAIEVASQKARVVVVATRVRDAAEVESIRAALGREEVIAVPEDPAIVRADEVGLAPIDVEPDSPGVSALVGLAATLAGERGSR